MPRRWEKNRPVFCHILCEMEDFEVRINAAEGPLLFRFTPVHTTRGVMLFSSVVSGGSQQFFQMQKNGAGWNILKAPQPPEWIFQFEQQLSKAIYLHFESAG